MKTKFPKYVIAEEWPESQTKWVVRLRNPLVLAHCIDEGLFNLRMECWPESVLEKTSPEKMSRILADMTRICAEDDDDDPPSYVGHFWPTDFRLPPYLTLYAPEPNEWMGVLEPGENRLWEITSEGDIEWIPEFGGTMDFPRVTRAVVKYFKEFERRENEVLGP